MYFLCLTVAGILLSGAAFATPACLDRLPHCNPSNQVGRFITRPENVTALVGTDAIFSAQSACPNMKVYIDGCLAGVPVHLHTGPDEVTSVTFNITNVQFSDDSKSIDIIMFCGGISCFHTVYLIVRGYPVSPNLSVYITCKAIIIDGSLEAETELVLQLFVSNNTVYNKTLESLPVFINNEGNINPENEYSLLAYSRNEVASSEPIKKLINFRNFTQFNIVSREVTYFGDNARVEISLSVNYSCPMSVPRSLKILSTCLKGGHHTIDILETQNNYSLDLFTDEKTCSLVFSSGGIKEYVNLSVVAVQDVFIPKCTKTGYFIVNCTLLAGVTGCAVKVLDKNGAAVFSFIVNRTSAYSAIGKSTDALANGNYTVNVYALMSDGSFNHSLPLVVDIPLTCVREQGHEGRHDDAEDFIFWIFIILGGIIGAGIILAIIVIPIVIVLLYKFVIRRRQKYPVEEEIELNEQNSKKHKELLEGDKNEDNLHSVPLSQPQPDTGTPEPRPHTVKNYPVQISDVSSLLTPDNLEETNRMKGNNTCISKEEGAPQPVSDSATCPSSTSSVTAPLLPTPTDVPYHNPEKATKHEESPKFICKGEEDSCSKKPINEDKKPEKVIEDKGLYEFVYNQPTLTAPEQPGATAVSYSS